MTNLALPNDDDYPGAAKKHLEDADALVKAKRFDGAGYLLGYVLECSLRAVILVGKFEQLGSIAPQELTRELRPESKTWKRFRKVAGEEARSVAGGHDLATLAKATTSYASVPNRATAKYVLSVDDTKLLHDWKPSLRYRAGGKIAQTEVEERLATADAIYERTIGRMIRDGLVQP